MDLHIRDGRCITILLPRGSRLSKGGTMLLVNYLQRRRGLESWGAIHADLFPGHDETLMIVRPMQTVSVRLAEYILPFLNNYFMD